MLICLGEADALPSCWSWDSWKVGGSGNALVILGWRHRQARFSDCNGFFGLTWCHSTQRFGTGPASIANRKLCARLWQCFSIFTTNSRSCALVKDKITGVSEWAKMEGSQSTRIIERTEQHVYSRRCIRRWHFLFVRTWPEWKDRYLGYSMRITESPCPRHTRVLD